MRTEPTHRRRPTVRCSLRTQRSQLEICVGLLPVYDFKKPTESKRCCYVSLAWRVKCSTLYAHLRLNSDLISHSTRIERICVKMRRPIFVLFFVVEMYLSINECWMYGYYHQFN